MVQNCYNAGSLRTGSSTERIGSLAGYPLDGRYRDGLTVLTGAARARLGWRSSQGDSVAQCDTLTPDVFPGLVRGIGGLNGGYPLFDWQLLESRGREAVIAYLADYYAQYVQPYVSAAQRQTFAQLLTDTSAALRSAASADAILTAYDAAMACLTSPELLAQAVAAAQKQLTARYQDACKAHPHIAADLLSLYEKQRAALTACTAANETDTVLDAFAAGVVDCLLLKLAGLPMKELAERLPQAEAAAAALTDAQRGMLLYYGRLPERKNMLALYQQNIEKLTQWSEEDKTSYRDLWTELTELAETGRQALDDAVDAEGMTAALDVYCAGVAEALITAIGPVPELLTVEDAALYQKAILRAQAYYNRLSDVQKELVPNLEELEAAQARYQQFEKDLAAARQVEGLIAAIGTVTADSLAALQRAQTAYDALTAAQKILVSPAMLTLLQTGWTRWQELGVPARRYPCHGGTGPRAVSVGICAAPL